MLVLSDVYHFFQSKTETKIFYYMLLLAKSQIFNFIYNKLTLLAVFPTESFTWGTLMTLTESRQSENRRRKKLMNTVI